MLTELIAHTAAATGTDETTARKALGVVLNAADRQGSVFAITLFSKMPGARTLAADVGDELGTPNGLIARLIEQTPGGRRHVAARMMGDLRESGLGHNQVGQLLPAIADFAEQTYGMTGFGHLGDLMGKDITEDMKIAAAA